MSSLPPHDTDLARYRARVERVLSARLERLQCPRSLGDAMRYAVLGGGKRLRASLVYATGEALGAPEEDLDAGAAAVEMIHAYSLVHDDLPCMDDDDERRGRPSCHRAFGEAIALLAGDALQTAAFETLADGASLRRLQMLSLLAKAAGPEGMVGGQVSDLESGTQAQTVDTLEDMHLRKTGALIRASVLLGGLAAEGDATILGALTEYGRCVGLAFQIMDDVLDCATDTDRTSAAPAATYPGLLGLETARARAVELRDRALVSLGILGDNGSVIRALADFAVNRTY
ncbi:MAG: polyprenyl synthetase family protein [Acidiferrobacteraceae bacterium]